jgi:alpha-tubulin suppressor-like RCC1 family protein
MAIKTDGTMWSWGQNSYGRLGLGDTTNKSSPVQVGALTNWLKLSAGVYNAVAIKTDGTLWAIGRGNYGQLGLGDTTNRSSPVQVGALTTWVNISGKGTYTLAIG